jgi:hypothetical protein
MILKDIDITIGGTDLSGYGRALTMTEGSVMQQATAYGDDWDWFEAGLRTGGVTIQFWQAFGAGKPDAVLSALLATTATVVIKPLSATVATNNPTFTFTAAFENYERFAGQIGDRGVCQVDLVLGANTGIVRATS